MSPIEAPAPDAAAGREASAGTRALDFVLLAAPLVLLAVFFRDLWYAAQAFSLESADNLDLVYSDPQGCRGYFDAHATLLAQQDGFRLYRLNRALPRFHVPERIVWTEDTLGAFSEGGCPEYGKRTLGVLNADGLPRESRQSGRVTQVEIPRGEEVRLHVQADTPAHVILGIHRHPWWEARVDGRPARLLRANSVFMAVEVPPGTHVVELRCRARSLIAGIWVSGLSLAAFVVFYAWRGAASLRRR